MKKLQKMKLLTLILLGLLTFSCNENLNEPLNEIPENSFILKKRSIKI
jgi:hypothetical protein